MQYSCERVGQLINNDRSARHFVTNFKRFDFSIGPGPWNKYLARIETIRDGNGKNRDVRTATGDR